VLIFTVDYLKLLVKNTHNDLLAGVSPHTKASLLCSLSFPATGARMQLGFVKSVLVPALLRAQVVPQE
jgi:hypothetical protein